MAGLERFIEAQGPVMAAVEAELRAGRKRSHWMWFVFPQLRGLGMSSTAQFYGIEGMGEARAFLAHPVLGTRLVGCVRAVLAHRGVDAHAIFGSPDDMKFRSCLTLFGRAAPGEAVFRDALAAFYPEGEDGRTVALLEAG